MAAQLPAPPTISTSGGDAHRGSCSPRRTSRAGADKTSELPGLVIREGLHDLFTRVHHERAVARHGFAQRTPSHEDGAASRRAAFEANLIAISQHRQFLRVDGGRLAA